VEGRGEDYTTLLVERDKLLSGRTKPRNLTNLSDKPIDKTDRDKCHSNYNQLLIEQIQLTPLLEEKKSSQSLKD